MIIDLAECKRLVQLTKEDYDALIETLIPICQQDLCDYLNNYFWDYTISYWGSEISFVAGAPDTITDGESEFSNYRFAAGMDVVVQGTDTNDGIHELATVTAGTLTLTSSNELVSMAYDDSENPIGSVRITRVNWPKSVKIVVARMVWYLIHRDKPDGELSKVIDGVSTNWDRTGSYPREILNMANKYRRPEFV